MRRLGHRPWFAAVGRRVVRLDGALFRLTGGRVAIGPALGPPELLLTATGHRTGQPRTVPLSYLADGADYVVIASNWGRPRHPAWSDNLIAVPAAGVALRGRELPVLARQVDAEEKARLWPRITELWPAYDTYAARSGRDLRVFRLTPTADPASR